MNMHMEYLDFVEQIRRQLLVKTGLGEEQIFFQKKGSQFSEKGDRLFVECASFERGREMCGIYITDLYESYVNGTSVVSILSLILEDLKKMQRFHLYEKTKDLSSYEKAKHSLFIRLLNVPRHAEELRHAVYRQNGDIALVLYLKLAETENSVVSAKVHDEYMGIWGRGRKELLDMALVNTMRMAPPRIYHWEKLLSDAGYDGEDFMGAVKNIEEEIQEKSYLGFCLSTTKRTNGAVAIFFPGVAKRLAAVMGQDLYLAFTSIHEAMVHGTAQLHPEDLERVVKDTIREATTEDEYLTENIYRYDRSADTITCVSEEM